LQRFVLLLFLLLTPAGLRAELMVIQIDVNGLTRGEFFAEREVSGHFLLPVADLPALGLLITPQTTVTIGVTSYFSLAEFPDISANFDEGQLTLSLTSPPHYLPATIIDLSRQQHRQVLQPLESSAFVNYRFDFDTDSRTDSSVSGLTSEIGWRRRNLLFLSGQRYETADADARFTRQMTSATWEWRDELRRLIVGDAITPAGPIVPSVRFGGVTISRNFDLDPAFIQYPTFDYAGAIAGPGEIDIYQNGFKLRTEKLQPGPFQLENLTGAPGYGDFELVLRDQFGRESRLSSPYYLTDQLLKPGLQEYSYSAGLRRDGYGTNEDRYSAAALLGRHRYGWSRRLTVGYSLQAGDGLLMISPQLDLLAGTAGIVSLAAGGSTGKGGGGAGLLRYTFNRRPFSTSFEYQYFSESWQTFSETTRIGAMLQQQVRGTIGWGSLAAGSLTINATQRKFYNGSPQTSLGAMYSRRLFGKVSCNLFIQQTRNEGSELSAFAILTYSPANHLQTALRFEKQQAGSSQSIDLQRNAPAGAGYGYLATAGHRSDDTGSAAYLETSGEHHSRYLNIRGRGYYEGGDAGSATALSLSTAGALTWVGGHFEPSRPVEDSFALVRVGTLPEVKVYRNGEEVGRTDKNGLALIPGLSSYYDNRISIDDTDIPMDQRISKVEYFLSPPARSGSCVDFDVVRSQPITGRLFLQRGSDLSPVEYREVELLNAAGQRMTIPTGRGGEFYFAPDDFPAEVGTEPLVNGCDALIKPKEVGELSPRYRATLWIDDKERTFNLEVPVSDAIFIDLGKIVVAAEQAL
jgi:outer membrane usher protein FimD/PapC